MRFCLCLSSHSFRLWVGFCSELNSRKPDQGCINFLLKISIWKFPIQFINKLMECWCFGASKCIFLTSFILYFSKPVSHSSSMHPLFIFVHTQKRHYASGLFLFPVQLCGHNGQSRLNSLYVFVGPVFWTVVACRLELVHVYNDDQSKYNTPSYFIGFPTFSRREKNQSVLILLSCCRRWLSYYMYQTNVT